MADEADGEHPSLDEKAVWAGDVFRLLEDSGEEDQTDVPAGHSLGASLDESDEERRSPPGEQRRPANEAPHGMRHFELPQRSPPGLHPSLDGGLGFESSVRCPPISRPPPPPGPVPPQPLGPARCMASASGYGNAAAVVSDDEDDEDDADDEEYGLGAPPPGMDGPNSAWYAELPSIGSANHFNGACDRCCFHPKGRCLNGYNCQHCHFDHEKRKRKNKKKNKGSKVSPLGCGDECADMVSTSAEGSVPVSPDKSFGSSILAHAELAGGAHHNIDFAAPHQVEFPSALHSEFSTSAPGMMATGNAPEQCDSVLGECAQQSLYFQGATASETHSAPNMSSESFLGANKWYTGPSTQLCSGSLATTPPMDTSPDVAGGCVGAWKGAGYAEAGTSQGFPGQSLAEAMPVQQPEMKAAYLEEPDRRDEYIHQLEAENRYLRACLSQYMGPGASAMLPQRGGAFSGPLGTAPPAAMPSAGSLSAALGAPSSLDTALLAPPVVVAQGLSPGAAPFYPAGQPWQDLSSCYQAADSCPGLDPQNLLHAEVPACSTMSSMGADELLVSGGLA